MSESDEETVEEFTPEAARNLSDYALGHMTAVLNVCATLIAWHPFRPIVEQALVKFEGLAASSSSEPFRDGFRAAMAHLKRTVQAVDASLEKRTPNA